MTFYARGKVRQISSIDTACMLERTASPVRPRAKRNRTANTLAALFSRKFCNCKIFSRSENCKSLENFKRRNFQLFSREKNVIEYFDFTWLLQSEFCLWKLHAFYWTKFENDMDISKGSFLTFISHFQRRKRRGINAFWFIMVHNCFWQYSLMNCLILLCWVTFCIHSRITPVGQFSRKCAKSVNQA